MASTALIGALGGIVSGLSTGVINVIKEKNANKAAIEKTKADAELARANAEAEAILIKDRSAAEIAAAREARTAKALEESAKSEISAREHDTAIQVDSKWANIMRVIIRPLWAIAILLLFSFAKVCVIIAAFRMLSAGMDPLAVAGIIMDEPTTAIMSTITGFYFGQRYGEKMVRSVV